MFLEDNRIYYAHDANCSEDNFTETSAIGLKICLECHGVFDEKGKGVCVTSKKFD